MVSIRMPREYLTLRPRYAALLAGIAVAAAACSAPSHPIFRHELTGTAVPWTQAQFDTSAGRFTFAVISDLNGGGRPGVFEVAAAQLTLLRPELVMSVGDLIDGPAPVDSLLTQEWEHFDTSVRTIPAPLFRVGGNHDLTGSVLRDVWRRRYGSTYYSFVYKNVLFLVLDTEDLPPERARKLFEARSTAIKALREGKTSTDSLEYYRMPERISGGISAEQSAYVQQALTRHPDVRWTFLFFHKPLWRNESDVNFRAVETALANRPYTVFSGHLHSLARTSRHGRDYFTLGTTGGSQDSTDAMALDHVTLVTMSTAGPSIAHVRLDGILDADGKLPRGGDSLCFRAARCGGRQRP